MRFCVVCGENEAMDGSEFCGKACSAQSAEYHNDQSKSADRQYDRRFARLNQMNNGDWSDGKLADLAADSTVA